MNWTWIHHPGFQVFTMLNFQREKLNQNITNFKLFKPYISAHIGSKMWVCLIWIVVYLLETGLFPYLPISDIDLAVEKQHGVEEGTTSLPTPVNDGRQQKSLVSLGFQRTTFFRKRVLMEIVTEQLTIHLKWGFTEKRLLWIGNFSYRHSVCV